MRLSRAEVGAMSDTMLQVAVDGAVHRLRREWDSGRNGKLCDIYDLAILQGEFVVRGFEAAGPLPAQLFSGVERTAL